MLCVGLVHPLRAPGAELAGPLLHVLLLRVSVVGSARVVEATLDTRSDGAIPLGHCAHNTQGLHGASGTLYWFSGPVLLRLVQYRRLFLLVLELLSQDLQRREGRSETCRNSEETRLMP
jgi:hypothetical protein